MASGVIGNFIGGAFGDLFSLQTILIISMVAHLPAIIPVIKLEMMESRSRLKELFNFSGLQNDQRKVLYILPYPRQPWASEPVSSYISEI